MAKAVDYIPVALWSLSLFGAVRLGAFGEKEISSPVGDRFDNITINKRLLYDEYRAVTYGGRGFMGATVRPVKFKD